MAASARTADAAEAPGTPNRNDAHMRHGNTRYSPRLCSEGAPYSAPVMKTTVATSVQRRKMPSNEAARRLKRLSAGSGGHHASTAGVTATMPRVAERKHTRQMS